jgi:transposase-like protein
LNDVLEFAFCHNPRCPDFLKLDVGNIAYRGTYGKNNDKVLLYCKTCGKRFAASRDSPLFGAHLSVSQVHQIIHHAAEGVSVRATARLLGLSKNTVNLAIVKVGEHCQKVYRSLMKDLKLNEVQLDDLWTFVKKKRLLTKVNLSEVKEKPGAGQL